MDVNEENLRIESEEAEAEVARYTLARNLTNCLFEALQLIDDDGTDEGANAAYDNLTDWYCIHILKPLNEFQKKAKAYNKEMERQHIDAYRRPGI